jgi:hypothetical protein
MVLGRESLCAFNPFEYCEKLTTYSETSHQLIVWNAGKVLKLWLNKLSGFCGDFEAILRKF